MCPIRWVPDEAYAGGQGDRQAAQGIIPEHCLDTGRNWTARLTEKHIVSSMKHIAAVRKE